MSLQFCINIMTHYWQDIKVLLECILHEKRNSMLTTCLIPSGSMYKVVILVTQDLLRNQVIRHIILGFLMTLDLCLEYQQI